MRRALFVASFGLLSACGSPSEGPSPTGGAGGDQSGPLGGGGSGVGGGGAGGAGGEGAGGGGGAAECAVASDCGDSTECLIFSCDGGVCIFVDLQGQYIDDPLGNCTRLFCDASVVNTQFDPTDVPPSTACVDYYCDTWTPDAEVHFGLPCPGGLCDDSGDCVACLAEPGCVSWPCLAYDQLPGDCVEKWCADESTELAVADDTDLPDVPDCTTIYTCENGVLTAAAAIEGSPCHGGDGECNAAGECACVSSCECTQAGDCVTNQFCMSPTCNLGFCGLDPVPSGQLSPVQAVGNCQTEYCGDFGVFSLPNGGDTPPPSPCNWSLCDPFPDYQAYSPGTPCPGGFCDGVLFGTCYPCFGGQGTCPSGSHCDPSPVPFGSSCIPD